MAKELRIGNVFSIAGTYIENPIPMVLGTDNPKAMGERIVGIWDHTGAWHPYQPVVVVRESTKNAWLAWNASMGNTDPRMSECRTAYFYEVVSD